MKRYLTRQVEEDLQQKMVFLGGPRQVGKTTLALQVGLKSDRGYLNYDIPEDREQILKRQFPETSLWIFDEIHKYRPWRNYLKGVYDAFKGQKRILVTGSARLDYYRFGGDSLQGRYHFLRLHPLSVAELKLKNNQDLLNLLKLGGFPEPFLSGSAKQAKRWSREYRNRLIREDLLSLEKVQDIGNLELALLRLPELVGSPLSINALREDLQVSHKTLSNWLNILERLYAIFRLSPFGSPKIRAVKKEQKHYHWDWTLVDEQSLRFENMVACHLLKFVHYQQDTQGLDYDLCYFRDVDRREVDFVITNKRKPLYFIEAKWSDQNISPGLKYLKKRFSEAKAIQISAKGQKDYVSQDDIRVMPALAFLRHLNV